MFRSLYTTVKPYLDRNETGSFTLTHYSSKTGSILLNKGNIVGITYLDQKGTEAARTVLNWLKFKIGFDSTPVEVPVTSRAVSNTARVVAYLEKADAAINKSVKSVSGCEAVLRFDQESIQGVQSFSRDELNISLSMDGVKTVGEIMMTSGLSDLQTLVILSRFVTNDFAKLVTPHTFIPESEIRSRIDELTGVLLDITGPVASLLVDEVCQEMGLSHACFCETDYRSLVRFVRDSLDPEEQPAFDTLIRQKLT